MGVPHSPFLPNSIHPTRQPRSCGPPSLLTLGFDHDQNRLGTSVKRWAGAYATAQSDKQRQKTIPPDAEARPQSVDKKELTQSSGRFAKYLLDPLVLPEELAEYRRSVL